MARGNTWGSNLEFILTLIGYTVGVSNIWRFPYLCMRNGGGSFLIPYLTCLFLCAMPLFVLEVCAGQFSGLGAIKVWQICPLFKGLGVGCFIVMVICVVYYNVIISWAIYYLIQSCARVLPWSSCDNEWNTPSCWIHQDLISNNGTDNQSTALSMDYSPISAFNSSLQNDYGNISMNASQNSLQNSSATWVSPADEFWNNHALQVSSGVTDLGGMKWDLAGCLTLSFAVAFLCLFKGTKSLGKVVYVTAPLPYLLLAILLVRGILLPGSAEGIKFYIIPDFKRLLSFKVWTEAGLQVFYSIGPAWGSLFTMSSYNKFTSPCIRDAIAVSLIGAATSFLGGFAIFSVIGFMAFKTGLAVTEIIASGPALAFIAYPEALSRMPLAPFWAILFFLMLVVIGINSEIFFIETVINCIHELFPWFMRRKKTLMVGLLCIVSLLAALVMSTRGGIYIFILIDWYVGPFVPFVNGILECIIIFYIYGHRRFYADIELMFGSKPSLWWKFCWGYICPPILIIIFAYNIAAFGEPYYRDYTYPKWVISVCLFLSSLPILPFPIGMIKVIAENDGSFLERLQASIKPSSEWGPADSKIRSGYNVTHESEGCFSLLDICHQKEEFTLPDEVVALNKM